MIHFDGKFIAINATHARHLIIKKKKHNTELVMLMHLKIFAVALERVKRKIAEWPFEIEKKERGGGRERKRENARTHHCSSNEQHALQASAF